MRAFLVVTCLVAVALGACGFLPEDDFTGKRAGDGIAPWTDLGPVQVCLGNQYLGPAANPPGGLCFDENISEEPCTRDSQCGSREACVCGRCTVAYCAAASDCTGGRTCSFSERRCDVPCFADSECAGPGDTTCFNGVCRGRCLDDSECQTGEICDSRNYCTTADCEDDDGCLAGERCRVQRVPRQVLEPSPLATSTPARQIVLWLEVSDPVQVTQTAIWRAISSDGIHFTMSPAQPVVIDGNTARAPSVIRTDAGYAMYYEASAGAQIRVVTSTDGITWSAPVAAIPGGTGPAAARAPAAVRLPDGSVAVYYQIGDGAAIGLATGAVGDALDVRGPVLRPADVTVAPGDPGAPFWDDVQRLQSPYAALTESADGVSLRLWFSAFGRESADSLQFGVITPIPPNFSIGYAAAPLTDPGALAAWPYGPVADRVSAFLTHHDELGPGVAQLPGEDGADDAYLMYYVEANPAMGAMGADGPFVIGRLGALGNGAYAEITGALE